MTFSLLKKTGVAVISMLALSCLGYEDAPETEKHWSVLYTEDNCARCPMCCTSANELAFLDDGDVCMEENQDKALESGWTNNRIRNWCLSQSENKSGNFMTDFEKSGDLR